MSRIRIKLFDTLSVTAADDTPLPLGGKKTNALLAYLAATTGKAIRREVLAELLWPDRFEKQSQQSFRQALSSARKLLGPDAGLLRDTDDGALTLDASEVSTDVGDFEQLRASPLPEDQRAALDLYTGDFLNTLGAVSESFDQWALQTRAHLKALAIELFEETAKSELEAGYTDKALETARRLVEIDPAHEEGHRLLMRLYLAKGQRSAALRQYEACQLALAQHLDAVPDGETEALAASIKSEGSNSAGQPVRTPTPQSPKGSQQTNVQKKRLSLSRIVATLTLAALLAVGLWSTRSLFFGSEVSPSGIERSEEPTQLICKAPRPFTDQNEPVLLLLPTKTLSEDKDLQLFGQSTTEAIQAMSSVLTELTLVAGPRVGHPDRDLAPVDLAKKNAATQIFETTIEPESDGQRITMRIVDGTNGREVWQSTFTEADLLGNAGHVQNEIAMRAAWGIQEQITEGNQALFHRQYEPESFAVFEHVTRGFGLLGEISPLYNDLARKDFQDALTLEPDNPSAHAGLGFTYLSPLLFHWQTGSPGDLARAKEEADLAAKLDPAYAPAQNLQALILLLEGDVAAAQEKIDKGLLLSGAGADSTAFGGYVYSYSSNPRRALELASRALVLRPYGTPTWYQWSYARALRVSGDPQGAVNCLSDVNYDGAGTVTPALEMILAYDAMNTPELSAPYVDLVLDRFGGAFSARTYCTAPAYSNQVETENCTDALVRAGLPE